MPDPIRDLESFPTDGLDVNPLSPAEVRRRGDRMRRRRHATAAAAGVAAVALVVVPIAVATSNGEGASPRPPVVTDPTSTGPSDSASEPGDDGGWRTEIPADFPLDMDLHSPEGEPIQGPSPDVPGINPLQICPGGGQGPSAWPDAYADRLAARATGPEFLDGRELVTAADGAAAERLLDGVQEMVQDCGRGDPAWTVVERPDLGDQALALSRLVDVGTGTDVYLLVRVGNAVLALDAGGEWEPGTVPTAVADLTERALPLVGEMCPFAENPCPSGSRPATTPDAGGDEEPAFEPALDDTNLPDPDQLPEVEGMPWQQVPPQQVPTLACQGGWLTSLEPLEMVSRELRITAASAGADLGMVNAAVLRFGDRSAADAAYAAVRRDWLDACPATHATFDGTRVAEPVAAVDVATSPDLPAADRAHRTLATYLPESCDPGCEAAWWDHQTVVQLGSRLVLVSHAEVAGACGPVTGSELDCEDESLRQPWLERVRATTEHVVARATWDQH